MIGGFQSEIWAFLIPGTKYFCNSLRNKTFMNFWKLVVFQFFNFQTYAKMKISAQNVGSRNLFQTLHSVFPRIPSKNPKVLFFEPKSSFGMFLRHLVKWFFHLCDFRSFFDFLKKCSFADFSTLHKKSLVKFYVFHHGFQTCRWIYKISSASLSSIYGPQFVLSGF